MKTYKGKDTVNAVRTSDGFIEVVSLELLDAMVGGYIEPEGVYCEVKESDFSNLDRKAQEGVN